MLLLPRLHLLRWIAFGPAVVFLAGCTKTSQPVLSLLSLSLNGMTSTYNSPFEQNMDSDGYVIFKGTCPSSVTGVEIQMNASPWVSPPATDSGPQGAETAPSTAHTWDVDCSDGTFSFWIYEHDMSNLFPSITDPDVIRLRGTGGLLPTNEIVFTDSDDNGGGTPHHLVLRRSGQPAGAIAESTCESLRIAVVDAIGNETTTPSALIVDITRYRSVVSGSGTPDGPSTSFSFSTDPASCSSTYPSAALARFTIPAGASGTTLYYKPLWQSGEYVSGSDRLNLAFSLGLISGTLPGAAQGLSMDVIASNTPFIFWDLPNRLVKDVCYPLHLMTKSLYGSNHSTTEPLSLTFTTSPHVSIYSDVGCSTPLTTGAIAASDFKSPTYYFKATTAAANLVQVSVAGSYTTFAAPLPNDLAISLDEANLNVPSLLSIEGGSPSWIGDLAEYRIYLKNENHAVVLASSPKTVTLSLSQSLKGRFFDPQNGSDACTHNGTSWTCSGSGSPSPSVQIAVGQSYKQMVFKADWGGAYNIQAISSGLTGAMSSVHVNGLAKLSFIAPNPSVSLDHFECKKATLELLEYSTSGSYYSSYSGSASSLTVSLSGLTPGAAFSDPSCLSGLASITVPTLTPSVDFYFRLENIGFSSTTRSLVASAPTTGLDPASIGLTVNAAPSLLSPFALVEMGTGETLYPHTVGMGAAAFSFNVSGGGTSEGIQGLNLVKFIADVTEGNADATLTFTDARGDQSSPIQVDTFDPKVDLDFVNSWMTTDTNDAKLVKSIRFGGASIPAANSNYLFSRSTIGTYVNKDGHIATAAIGEPRFVFDPSDAACASTGCAREGFLIEGPGTNLVSTNLSNTSYWPSTWGNGVLSRATGAISPDGSTSSQRLTYLASATDWPMALVAQTGHSITAGQRYTYSMYVKKASGSSLASTLFKVDDTSGNHTGVSFDFDGPSGGLRIAATSYSGTSTYDPFLPDKFGAIPHRDGWYRVWFSFTAVGSMAGKPLRIWLVPIFNQYGYTSGSWDATASGAIDVWGMQAEAQGEPSSYIPCPTGGCNRAPDQFRVATVPLDAPFYPASWLDGAAGTFKVDFSQRVPQKTTVPLFSLFDTTLGSSFVRLGLNPAGALGAADYSFPATIYAEKTAAGRLRPGRNQASLAFSIPDSKTYVSMGNDIYQGSISGSYLPSTIDLLWFGEAHSETNRFSGVLRSFRYWNRMLSKPAVQSMGIATPP